MKRIHSFLKFSVLTAVLAAMALTLLACGSGDEGAAEGTEITITIAVINKAGETTETTTTETPAE